MAAAACVGVEGRQLVMFEVGRREVTVAFDGGEVVTDAGLSAVRQLDRRLGVLAEAAARLPDPRSELLRQFSTEDLLTQTVCQLLGGDFECNVAQTLRHDPLMQVLLDQVQHEESATLASSSTPARFRQAFTRRQRSAPVDERTIDQECQAAKCSRLRKINRSLVELFVKTRTTPSQRIVLDIDATDLMRQMLRIVRGWFSGRKFAFPSNGDRRGRTVRQGDSPLLKVADRTSSAIQLAEPATHELTWSRVGLTRERC